MLEDISTEGLVLRTRVFGESDLIVVLLSRDYGKVGAIAKGARRSKRRFPGGVLAVFQHVRIRFARRPHSSLAFLHDCQLVRSHHELARDVFRFAWGSYLCELADVMIPERDPCPDVFDLLAETLEAMSSQEAPEPIAHHFVLGLLDRAGWGPDFSVCGICAEPIGSYSRPILDQRGSGVICATHEAEQQGLDPNDPSFRPSRRVIYPELLAYLGAVREARSVQVDASVIEAATALLDRLVGLHVAKPLKSRQFLASIRGGPAVA